MLYFINYKLLIKLNQFFIIIMGVLNEKRCKRFLFWLHLFLKGGEGFAYPKASSMPNCDTMFFNSI